MVSKQRDILYDLAPPLYFKLISHYFPPARLLQSLCELGQGNPSSRWTQSCTRILGLANRGAEFHPPLVSSLKCPCEWKTCTSTCRSPILPPFRPEDSDISLLFKQSFLTVACQTTASACWSTEKSPLSYKKDMNNLNVCWWTNGWRYSALKKKELLPFAKQKNLEDIKWNKPDT